MPVYTEEHAQKGLDAELPSIETWPNQFKGYEITIEFPEFTSVCPKTGLPDFGALSLVYTPGEKCLELKSFKEYLLAYRNLGIFYENVINRVLRDVVESCSPVKAELTGTFRPRGGMNATVRAAYDERAGFGA
ncbi:MAG: preQ(1) synthase [Acidobacteriota bacterium]